MTEDEKSVLATLLESLAANQLSKVDTTPLFFPKGKTRERKKSRAQRKREKGTAR